MSNTQKTKNDSAWEILFEQHQIISSVKSQGYFEITSEEINVVREARLMTKFDHKKNLPKIFLDNNLAILPITRGSYVISQIEVYSLFPKPTDQPINYLNFPTYLESLDYQNITSESAAINCAYVSGLLSEFLDDPEFSPTVSGRMSSGEFNFKIQKNNAPNLLDINVTNSQIEIDAGFESSNQFVLIEAKNAIADDFLVRQLYYPYRLWKQKISKPVIPIFLIYSNGLYHIYKFKFTDLNLYNSIELLDYSIFSFDKTEISLSDLRDLLSTTNIIDEPNIPFPQADSFERVINLCELILKNGSLSREDVTSLYDFDVRQTNYYTDAGRYLGLIEKRNEDGIIKYFLTELGRNIFAKSYRDKQLSFARQILCHSVFANTLSLYISKAAPPTKSEIVNLMKTAELYNISANSTYRRRASTILSWIEWILNLQSDT